MIIEKYEIAEYLEIKCPSYMETLTRKNKFLVYFSEDVIYIDKCSANSGKKIKIKLDNFYSFIIDVVEMKSLIGANFSRKYNQVYDMLPIAVEILLLRKENLNLYTGPKSKNNYIKNNNDEYPLPEESSLELSFEHVYKYESGEKKVELSEKEPHSMVDVYYATNREQTNDELIFGCSRSKDVHYGCVSVSIPECHSSGKVERPRSLGFSVFKINFKENKDKHFAIESGRALTKELFFNELVKESKRNSVTVFIHGFNVDFKSAVFKAAQIKFDLNYDNPMVLFSWPSQGKFEAYSGDKEQVFYSSDKLAFLLSELAASGIDEILVIAHSMGSLCLSEAIDKMKGSDATLSRLALAAPDIEKNTFIQNYHSSMVSIFKNITLYVSSKDWALSASKKINNSQRLGDSENEITVVKGVETIDISEVDNGTFSFNHSYISESNSVLTDLYGFLINSLPASQRRLKSKRTLDGEEYWEIHRVT